MNRRRQSHAANSQMRDSPRVIRCMQLRLTMNEQSNSHLVGLPIVTKQSYTNSRHFGDNCHLTESSRASNICPNRGAKIPQRAFIAAQSANDFAVPCNARSGGWAAYGGYDTGGKFQLCGPAAQTISSPIPYVLHGRGLK